MELQWLVATGMHLEKWIKNFTRKGERGGFQCVKIPCNQPLRTGDAFHVPVPITLPDRTVQSIATTWLLDQGGFVFDTCTHIDGAHIYRTYIHSTGMCQVRMVSDGFVWVNNHLTTASQHRQANMMLFRTFTSVIRRAMEMKELVYTLVEDAIDIVMMKKGIY